MRIRFISATLIFLCMAALGGCSSNQISKVEKENNTLSGQILFLTGQVDILKSKNEKLTMELNDLKSKMSIEPQRLENLEAIISEIKKEIEKEKEKLEHVDITSDNQKQIEKFIRDYFLNFEK